MENDVYKYGRDITWSLPIGFQYETAWGAIFHQFQDYLIQLPQVNGYGCPKCAWTGGRSPAIGNELDRATLFNVFDYLRSIKVTPSFTFTCTQLTKDDLNDRYANYLLDMALDADSHFIVYDDRLKDYIKSKKSDAYVVASVIKPAMQFQGAGKIEVPTIERETELYNKLLKEYDLVVVRPEYSSTVLLEHPEYIDDISRVEVLINQPCIRECPRMPDHYRFMEQFRVDTHKKVPDFECVRKNLERGFELKNTLCHSEAMVSKLVEHGVKHLKVQGRGGSVPLIAFTLMIYGQMFRQDGPHNLHVICLVQGKVQRELEYFNEKVLGMRPPER